MGNGAEWEPLVRTSALLRRLLMAPRLEQFLESSGDALRERTFPQYLEELRVACGGPRERVIRRAGIERTYGHQLFRGIRSPSRDKVIQLAIGFALDVESAQRLLTGAQKSPLYPRIKRDAVLLYCIKNGLSFAETQGILDEQGLTLLGGDDPRG